jgi:hypothetical protein
MPLSRCSTQNRCGARPSSGTRSLLSASSCQAWSLSTPVPQPAASPRPCSRPGRPASTPWMSASDSCGGHYAPTSGVVNLERTNLAGLNRRLVPEPVDVIVMDLSYLSITVALGQLGGVHLTPSGAALGMGPAPGADRPAAPGPATTHCVSICPFPTAAGSRVNRLAVVRPRFPSQLSEPTGSRLHPARSRSRRATRRSLSATSSARAQSAVHAKGSVARRHPVARCLQ